MHIREMIRHAVLQGILHRNLEQDSLDNLAWSFFQLEEQMQMIWFLIVLVYI